MIITGAPFYYNFSNLAASSYSPSTVHVKNTDLSRYFKRYLLQKAISRYEFDCPEEWAKDYYIYTIFCRGYSAILNTDKFGIINQECSLYGYDVYYRPTHAIISNPLLRGIVKPRIGVQTEIIRLQPDYGSIMDLVNYYADMLALCAEGVGMNLVNSKLAYVFAAANKTAAESFKKLFDQIASGEVSAVIDKSLYQSNGEPNWQTFTQNLQQNFIAPEQLKAMRQIEMMFDADIGIPNSNIFKGSQMSVDEVNANDASTYSRASLWLETLQESMDKANKMFDLNLSVKWREVPDIDNVGETQEPGEPEEPGASGEPSGGRR